MLHKTVSKAQDSTKLSSTTFNKTRLDVVTIGLSKKNLLIVSAALVPKREKFFGAYALLELRKTVGYAVLELEIET